MTKKILSSAAVAALISTSAMAFDVHDDSATSPALSYSYTAASAEANTPFTIANRGQQGDALIFPAFNVGNGWETTIRVMNSSSTNAIVAKVVLYAGDDSRELRDFNIYLSANDVWEGTIKIDADGVAKLISTDDSAPLTDGTMASATTPMKTSAINAAGGYIEVIGCAAAIDVTHLNGSTAIGAGLAKPATADHDHAGLRAAYKSAADKARAIATPVVFNNGVITSAANVPGVDATAPLTTSTAATTSAPQYFFGDVQNTLSGSVRITDTVNGKDMVMPAMALRGVTDATATTTASTTKPMALMFVEGEAANIADRALTGANSAAGNAAVAAATTSEYRYTTLAADAANFNVNNVFMDYGDSSSAVNNQLLLTSPYKRLLVNADATLTAGSTTVTSNANTGSVGGLYTGVTANAAGTAIANWGHISALALIYDQSENQASASQFSPANTPTMNFNYELSASEGNSVQTDNLSYYLAQSGFNKGFVDLQFVNNGAATAAPTIPTQMIATEAAGKVITNWITPEFN